MPKHKIAAKIVSYRKLKEGRQGKNNKKLPWRSWRNSIIKTAYLIWQDKDDDKETEKKNICSYSGFSLRRLRYAKQVPLFP